LCYIINNIKEQYNKNKEMIEMLNYIESIKNAKTRVENENEDDRREKNKAIKEYQSAIKNSPYDWEKINGSEELVRKEGEHLVMLDRKTWKEITIK
jgi:uncharacterized protein YllA (UPF0747 family)